MSVNNVTNVNPMVTANTLNNGYITSAADILGRAYKLTAEFKWQMGSPLRGPPSAGDDALRPTKYSGQQWPARRHSI